MTILLSGTKRSNEILKSLHFAVERLKNQDIYPKLVVISVGTDDASSVYVKQKRKRCQELGLGFDWVKLPNDITQEQLHHKIDELNTRKDVSGIILQLPISNHLDPDVAIAQIDSYKDVDGFHPLNLGKLVENQAVFSPCTPLGIMDLLKSYDIDVSGKEVVIVGRSQIVGMPLSLMMTHSNATVTLTHSKTRNLNEHIKRADIVVMAAGNDQAVEAKSLKSNAVLVDVSIHRGSDGKLHGDIPQAESAEELYARTPVPGGVGPMTVIMLMKQTILAAGLQQGLSIEEIFTDEK